MSILEELLEPLPLQHFKDQYLFKEPYAAPFTAGRFADLISWPLIDHILTSGHGDCWLAERGTLPEDESLGTGFLTPQQVRESFANGKTVVIRNANRAHKLLEAVAADFNKRFCMDVDIQLYGTPAGRQGFEWHYDVEDVFVIQSIGEKEFYLRRNTITGRPFPEKLPKDLKHETETSKEQFRCVLKAGDWLYIPAGYWHKAVAIADSFHLSVGVLAKSVD